MAYDRPCLFWAMPADVDETSGVQKFSSDSGHSPVDPGAAQEGLEGRWPRIRSESFPATPFGVWHYYGCIQQ